MLVFNCSLNNKVHCAENLSFRIRLSISPSFAVSTETFCQFIACPISLARMQRSFILNAPCVELLFVPLVRNHFHSPTISLWTPTSCRRISGRGERSGAGYTVHLQRIIGVFNLLAYIRYNGCTAFCRQIFQGN